MFVKKIITIFGDQDRTIEGAVVGTKRRKNPEYYSIIVQGNTCRTIVVVVVIVITRGKIERSLRTFRTSGSRCRRPNSTRDDVPFVEEEEYGSFTDDRDEDQDEDDDDKMEEDNHDTDTADHDDASEENNVYNDSATRRILWTTVLHATGSLDSTDGRDDPNEPH